ncbi:MAG: carbohydrate ABC transporter permease [Rhodobacteraceae bacterium]|jgi:ABC-type glycerol-3-phosphate transport system permease component|nr:carbohydrate ABC transporter permease [Paracoccaceae bacterium]
MSRMRRRLIRTWALTVAAWLFVLAVSFPLIWMLASSFKSPTEITAVPPRLLPDALYLGNYEALFAGDFWRWFMNSIIVASGTVVIVIVLGTLGAYSLTRFSYPGQKATSTAILFTYLFPSVLMLVPLFLIIVELRIMNTYWALILADMTFAMPFSLWLLRSYFLSVPLQVEEAAMVDGASRFACFFQIVLPQVMPGIISTGIFAFILAWDDYLFASVFTTTAEMKTLPVGIARYANELNAEWGILMAASVSVTVPVLVLFAFLQRRLLPDLNAGAVKA